MQEGTALGDVIIWWPGTDSRKQEGCVYDIRRMEKSFEKERIKSDYWEDSKLMAGTRVQSVVVRLDYLISNFMPGWHSGLKSRLSSMVTNAL